MHYYPFNIADFNLHTAHLTLEEDAVYRRLIDFYYDTELPIPKETQPVIRRLRLVSYTSQFEQILSEFFTLEDDGWHNYRCDIEIKAYRDKADTARANGKKGGRPRKNKGLETQSVILANPEITGSQANQELRTKNQELINNTDYESIDPCPQQKIVDLYHSILPELPVVKVWGAARQTKLRARWKENPKHQSVEFWERLFGYIRQSTFLMNMDENRFLNLEWIVTSANFIKIIEEKYHA
jgi:uncharacterized protein YdaU (DUF1376 family)